MRSWIVALVPVLLCGAVGAADDAFPLPCARTDSACVTRTLRAHPVHRLDTWNDLLAKPLLERVQPAPPLVVEYLTLENTVNGYRERPRAAQVSPSFVAEVKAALADLPADINLLFVDKLAGILLVEDLGGTGYTDVIGDIPAGEVAGYIVLDAGVLAGRTANEWATWRESTPFAPEAGWQLQARIEADAQDTRRNAIQYILLHELGHVLAIGGTIHPPWTVLPNDATSVEGYTFFNLSWRVDAAANRYVSLHDDSFPLRKDVVYYFGPKLRASQMAEAYAQLAKTNFPSLYAATRPSDDFAESFASYVHVVVMKRPWEITMRHGDDPPVRFGACWDQPRCAGKRRALQQMLGDR